MLVIGDVDWLVVVFLIIDLLFGGLNLVDGEGMV